MEAMLQEVFLKLLNMSITAGWLIMAVIVIRFAFRNQMKGFRCALWGLVALRLIFPFSIESITSLIPSKEVIPPEILMDKTPAIDSGISVVDRVVNPILSNSFTPAPGDSVNPLQVVSFMAAVVWLMGVVGMLLYSLISYLLLRKKVSASMQLENNIYLCDDIDSPFILGMIKPRIYLPSGLEEDYRESVVAHEKAHLKRHDHWWKPLGFFLLSIYWFHPLIWVAYVLLCRDIELACDERVIKDMSDEDKKRYSKALLSCSVTHKMVMVCPLSFGEIGVKARIKSVLNYKKPAFWVVMTAIIVGVVVLGGFMTDPMKLNRFGEDFAGVCYDEEGVVAFWNLAGGAGNKDIWYYCPAVRIDNAEEMEKFITQFDVYYGLTQRKTVWGEEKAFLDYIEKYDTTFYEENSLVIAYLIDGSFAYDHYVNNITFEDGIVDIEIKRQEEMPGTAVPAAEGEWFMILPMEDAKLEGKELVVHKNGAPREDIVVETPQALECVANQHRLSSTLSENDRKALRDKAANLAAMNDSKNKHLTIQVIDNVGELENLLAEVQGVENAPTFKSSLRGFDVAFFYEKSLLLVHLNAGSGSYRYFINNVYTMEQTLCVEVAQKPMAEGSVITYDMTDWIFAVEVDKKITAECKGYDSLYVGEIGTESGTTMAKLDGENHLYRVWCSEEKWKEAGVFDAALNNYNNETDLFYFTPILKYSTKAELDALVQSLDPYFSFENKADSSLKELTAKYDNSFFEEKELFFVVFYSGGGSFRYWIDGAYSDGERFFVQIAKDSSITETTADVAYWLATIEVDKNKIENCTVFDAEVFMDYELLQQ